MKRILSLIFVLVIATSFCFSQVIKYPFGSATELTSTTDSLTVEFAISNTVTYIDIDSTTIDTNLTINLDIASGVEVGDLVYIQTVSDDTDRTITFGTGMENTALTNTATKTFVTAFVYDGVIFRAFGQKQND